MQWHFGPFRLDLANACLWHATQPVTLRPKTFHSMIKFFVLDDLPR
jgi:hypothetical protein